MVAAGPLTTVIQFLRHELSRDKAYLLPLRLFMGLGWLRTGSEKVLEIDWLTGELLAAKLSHQIGAGEIYFPFYEALVQNLFLPNAVLMSWIIMIGEFAVGLGLITGTLTNGALLGALFMNVNFVFAGWVNPSAFYIIIQVLLLSQGAGLVLGGDQLIGQRLNRSWLASTASLRITQFTSRNWLIVTAMFWLLGLSSLVYVRDFTPAGSVEDPAMLTTIMCMMTGITTLVFSIRTSSPTLETATRLLPSYGSGD